MNYVLLKQVHVSFALASIIGFILRWNWILTVARFKSPWGFLG
jgi:hypothetical protein